MASKFIISNVIIIGPNSIGFKINTIFLSQLCGICCERQLVKMADLLTMTELNAWYFHCSLQPLLQPMLMDWAHIDTDDDKHDCRCISHFPPCWPRSALDLEVGSIPYPSPSHPRLFLPQSSRKLCHCPIPNTSLHTAIPGRDSRGETKIKFLHPSRSVFLVGKTGPSFF